MRERHALKGEADLKALIEDIITERMHLETSYWSKIIERMYDSSDIRVLEEKIKENARSRMRSEI